MARHGLTTRSKRRVGYDTTFFIQTRKELVFFQRLDELSRFRARWHGKGLHFRPFLSSPAIGFHSLVLALSADQDPRGRPQPDLTGPLPP